MTHAVLYMAKDQGPDKSRDVEHKDQHHGFLRLKPDDLLGVNGGKGDSHRHPTLVGHGAGQQLSEIAVRQSLAQGLAQALQALCDRPDRHFGPGWRVLTQQGKSEPRRATVNGRRDQHRDRHKLAARLAARLGGQHISQTNAQRQHAADVAQRPTPTAHAAHGLRLGQFG